MTVRRPVRILAAIAVLAALPCGAQSKAQGKAGEVLQISPKGPPALVSNVLTAVVEKNSDTEGRVFKFEDLGVNDPAGKSMQPERFTIIGNLQIYTVSKAGVSKKIGNFAGRNVTVTIPYPKEPHAGGPVLYFWVRKSIFHLKEWVALKDLEKRHGVEVLESTDHPSRKVLVLRVRKWPVNDIIISWDG